jgi:DNA-binding PadR family transcriptional regulator
MSSSYLGEFEMLVALAVARLAPDAYGVSIQREITTRTPRAVTLGAVYATLVRLEDKRLLSAHDSAPTGERGGRSRRCYTLTVAGKQAIARSHDAVQRMMDGLEASLGHA